MDPSGLIVEVYKLVASKDGLYDVYEWGKKGAVGQVYLKKGEVWKIGETKQFNAMGKQKRYSQKWLSQNNLEYKTLQHSPNKSAKKSFQKYENAKIKKHKSKFGILPAGNKCFH